MSKHITIRFGRAHTITPGSDGWPESDFVTVDDATPVQPGWLYVDERFVDPASADGQRILANRALVDARIAAVRDSLRGKSVTAMTAAERIDLLVVMARLLGIEVRP